MDDEQISLLSTLIALLKDVSLIASSVDRRLVSSNRGDPYSPAELLGGCKAEELLTQGPQPPCWLV